MTPLTSRNIESQQTNRCKVICRKLDYSVSMSSVTSLVCQRNGASVLGGNHVSNWAEHFSIWAFEPKETFQLKSGCSDAFEKLNHILNKYQLSKKNNEILSEGIFCGGWIGYFGYELGSHIERVKNAPADDLQMDIIRLSFYDRAISYHHQEKTWYLIALEIEGDNHPADEKLDDLENILKAAQKVSVNIADEQNIEELDCDEFNCNITADYYRQALAAIEKYIYDGEVYQINFSQRFACVFNGSPENLYHWQNKFNPCPYAAFLDADIFSIVSTSPEMFLTVRDGIVRTKPIKGTRKRIKDHSDAERINSQNYTELLASEKEQAELNMIIDLERNDLGRICQYGTIKVSQARTIEQYESVFHAVAVVEGKLRNWKKNNWFCDLLKAAFPGGSITGAPKVRAMEIIAELEPTQRGVYTGSIGFLGLDGNVCLNIAIRTVIIKGKKAFVQTGGGIVADSVTESEWDETIIKARALLTGIKAVAGLNKNEGK